MCLIVKQANGVTTSTRRTRCTHEGLVWALAPAVLMEGSTPDWGEGERSKDVGRGCTVAVRGGLDLILVACLAGECEGGSWGWREARYSCWVCSRVRPRSDPSGGLAEGGGGRGKDRGGGGERSQEENTWGSEEQARPSLLLACKQQISLYNLNTKGKEGLTQWTDDSQTHVTIHPNTEMMST